MLVGYLFISSILFTACQVVSPPPPLYIGLIAPFTGPSAASGESIQRGMLLAIDEINARGGVLNRPLELLIRNVGNQPLAGEIALRDLLEDEEIVAVFGGIFNSVILEYLDTLHQNEIPLINPWGSLPGLTKNDFEPNYSFCLAVNNLDAAEFLTRYGVHQLEMQAPAILAENSSWGDSSTAGLDEWLTELGQPPVGIERFDAGETNMLAYTQRLQDAGADGLFLVANTLEGAALARTVLAGGWDVPIVSHWGISGGRFLERAGAMAAEGIYVLQTYSFFGTLSPQGQKLLDAYHARFDTRRVEEMLSPVGVAHGYDGVHLLALAIEQAGTTEGLAVKHALETMETPYEGVIKTYDRPFAPGNHMAYTIQDYMMTQWQNGRLVPARPPHFLE